MSSLVELQYRGKRPFASVPFDPTYPANANGSEAVLRLKSFTRGLPLVEANSNFPLSDTNGVAIS
jgi:hypothetical protein